MADNTLLQGLLLEEDKKKKQKSQPDSFADRVSSGGIFGGQTSEQLRAEVPEAPQEVSGPPVPAQQETPVADDQGSDETAAGEELARKNPVKVVKAIGESFDDPETRQFWDSYEKEIASGEAKIGQERSDSRRSASIGKMIKDLIDASALLYAANQGIEADLKLTDNNPEYERRLRDIETDIERKRQVLSKRMSMAKTLFSEQEGAKERAEARGQSQNEANKRAQESQRKELKGDAGRIYKEISTPALKAANNDELMRQLKADFPQIPESKLEGLLGEENWFSEDDLPKHDTIRAMYNRKAQAIAASRSK